MKFWQSLKGQRPVAGYLWCGWLALLMLTLLWDLSALDLATMDLIGSVNGFSLQHQTLLEVWLHDRLRTLGWLIYLGGWGWALFWKPSRTFRRADRVFLMTMVTINLLLIVGLKHMSKTSCPWSVRNWGGIASYVSHWRWGVADGGPGHCFPAGHASTAWAFAPLVLAAFWTPGIRVKNSAMAWINSAFSIGVVLTALTQTLRGAHYPSHSLWTGVICTGTSLMAWTIWQKRLATQRAHAKSSHVRSA